MVESKSARTRSTQENEKEYTSEEQDGVAKKSCEIGQITCVKRLELLLLLLL